MNNQKCYISPNLEAQFNDEFYSVNNDSNGHPRYVTHYLAFLNDNELGIGDYDIAKQRAKKLGFKVYRGKDFGGGFVTTSFNLENDIERIIEARDFDTMSNYKSAIDRLNRCKTLGDIDRALIGCERVHKVGHLTDKEFQRLDSKAFDIILDWQEVTQ